MAGVSTNAPGVFIVGEYLGVKREPGRPRTTGEGNWPDRFKIGVRVGSDVMDVEFSSAEAANAAHEAAGSPTKGDPITLPVRARAGARGGAEAWVFWRGIDDEAQPAGDYQ